MHRATPAGVDDVRSAVRLTYDRLAPDYAAWADRVTPDLRRPYAEEVVCRLPPGAAVLELGCGPGVPAGAILAERLALTGVDLSRAMVDLARANVPEATFVTADMASVGFLPASFAAAAAFYCLAHLPRNELGGLLGRLHVWLAPGALLVANCPAGDDPGSVEPNWQGAGPLHFSSFGPAAMRRLLEAAGFALERSEVVEHDEDATPVRFWWFVARRLGVSQPA